MTTPAELHADERQDWMTASWVIEAAILLMGDIDLDPATSQDANARIGASYIFTEEDNGLEWSWYIPDDSGDPSIETMPSRVLLNAPGRMVSIFWGKLIHEYTIGNVEQAFWVGFNMDQLRGLCGDDHLRHPLEFYWMIPRKRIRFVSTVGGKKDRPSHPNYLVWIPPDDSEKNWNRFCEVMGLHGRCFRGERGVRLRAVDGDGDSARAGAIEPACEARGG